MSNSQVTTIDVSNNNEVNRFVKLERKLLENHPRFISDIDGDVIKLLRKTSLFFQQSELCLFIVSKGSSDVGRCAAIINRKYQAQKDPGAGFIGFFAAAPDCLAEISDMMAEAEHWLKERGVSRVIAPANGGAPQSMGFLTCAYDEDPMFPFPWHPPYYREYMEALQYNPTYPLWYYTVDFSSEKYRNAKNQYADNGAVRIRKISKKNWNKDIGILTDLLNETFVNEWEFSTMDHALMNEFFGPMKTILEPEQILLAEVDERPVGFCFAMPDLTPLFRGFKGKVGLLQIIKLMTRAKKYERGGILGLGVIDEFRGKGISKALAIKLYSFYQSKGLSSGFYYPVNENNRESRGFAESIGGIGQVTYQVYDKMLA